jgi:IS30 family transposase
MEMANHKWLTDKTGIDIYFAHPYSSWEHGTNRKHKWTYQTFFLKELTLINNKTNEKPNISLIIDPGRYLDTKLHIK